MQDRATVEQALDPRTRLVLFKMLNSGLLSAIHGCISTGKEANVYHALRPDGGGLAVKVYKTSVLVFKDRDRCVAYVVMGWLWVRWHRRAMPVAASTQQNSKPRGCCALALAQRSDGEVQRRVSSSACCQQHCEASAYNRHCSTMQPVTIAAAARRARAGT